MPSGFVRMNRSPARTPPLRSIRSRCTVPLTLKPSVSSAPSLVWPPVSATPASLSTSTAPASRSNSSASIFASTPCGIVTTARAERGAAPIACRSLRQCVAVMRPKTHGSSTIERNASTDCTRSAPGGSCSTEASSGASRPTRTSSRRIGSRRASTRSRSVAPTFEPQPPQRIATVESSRITSGGARPGAGAGAGDLASDPPVALPSSISGRSEKRRMNRRSIRSFQRQTHAPSSDQWPRDATA